MANPTPAPSTSPTPGSDLKTIVNVRSTPFCSSIAQHFNAAVEPMLSNDRSFGHVDTQLVDLNEVFKHGDYQIRYSNIRIKLMKYVADVQRNLPVMQQQINQLRRGEALTQDSNDARDIHQIAEKLQLAYNKQMQLATDLTGVIHAMMDYQPQGDADSYQNQLATAQMPQEMRDIKSYLRFDGQRTVIDEAENAAADSAITLVERSCAVNK
ncbi:MAG TPA: hypothetical protein VJP85_04670 [Candidatus Baltobacteraceae bacterium]|nr:hypothetical protein [Candidatus Baltobacteraceae bacterium]